MISKIYQNRANKSFGFTLLELSVVIVLIGLSVAAVVGGFTLVRQSKTRSIISDYNKYKIAASSFKLEYNSLMGDLANASAYGLGDNGNGDRIIHGRLSEIGYAWQHLKNAGLVSGAYNVGQSYYPGNSPPTAFGKDIYPIFTSVPRGNSSWNNDNCIFTWGDAIYLKHTAMNLIAFGERDIGQGYPGQGYDCPQVGFLTVAEASGLDKKIDDGLPDTGILFVANTAWYNTDGNRCVDKGINQSQPVNYDYNETEKTCRLIFKLGL
jgi:prepilin-type N-terminal cleavage/methylation domain-containing protein